MDSNVHEGKNGWLFPTGALVTLYGRNSTSLPDAKLRQWVSVIETRAARLEQMGIQYVHMPAPEKLTMITS